MFKLTNIYQFQHQYTPLPIYKYQHLHMCNEKHGFSNIAFSLFFFAKNFMLDVWQGSKYASDNEGK